MVFNIVVKSLFKKKNLYSGLESSKNLSSSAPCAVNQEPSRQKQQSNPSSSSSFESPQRKDRVSKDSAMEDENCRSLSAYTDSTEQSAPVNFDLSNRVCVICIFFSNYLNLTKGIS